MFRQAMSKPIGFYTRDYGDNPHIRKKHGEASKTHSQEPWERRYKRKKKRKRR